MSPQHNISSIVVAATLITPLASFSEKMNKRKFSNTMDNKEEDTYRRRSQIDVEYIDRIRSC